MNLHEYYKGQKGMINTGIMEIACELAQYKLMTKYNKPLSHFVEKDPGGDFLYKPEFQDEFNIYYDEQYERLACLMKFDVGEDDGVRKDSGISDYDVLSQRSKQLGADQLAFITKTLKMHGCRITLEIDEAAHKECECDNDIYPIITTLWGKNDNYNIGITSVYLQGDYEQIMADGQDTNGGFEKGFIIYPEQFDDVAYFISCVLEQNKQNNERN